MEDRRLASAAAACTVRVERMPSRRYGKATANGFMGRHQAPLLRAPGKWERQEPGRVSPVHALGLGEYRLFGTCQAKSQLDARTCVERVGRFGQFASADRKNRGQGKPESFEFPGMTYFCGRTGNGNFRLGVADARRADPRADQGRTAQTYAPGQARGGPMARKGHRLLVELLDRSVHLRGLGSVG